MVNVRRDGKGVAPWALALVGLMMGCSPTERSLPRYAAQSGENGWEDLLPGRQLFFDTRGQSCPMATSTRSESPDAWYFAEPLSAQAWAKQKTLWIIQESVLIPEQRRITLRINAEGQESHRVSLPVQGGSCTFAVDPTIAMAGDRWVNRSIVFAPWLSTCAALEVAGASPASTLFDADPGTARRVSGTTLAPALASGEGEMKAWLVLDKGALRVRLDVAERCFVDAKQENAEPPSRVASYLHAEAEHCVEGSFQGKPYVKCQSSVGTWYGMMREDALSLRLVRATHGPLHFVDGRLVEPDVFARSVVAVQVISATGLSNQTLGSSLQGAMNALLGRQRGSLRVARPGDPAITLDYTIRLAAARVGDLRQSPEQGTSSYEGPPSPRPNPAKAEARDALDAARRRESLSKQRVESSRAALEQAIRDKEKRDQELERVADKCSKAASKSSRTGIQIAGGLGCPALGVGLSVLTDNVPDKESAVRAANQELEQASRDVRENQGKIDRLPDSIMERPTLQFTYTKQVFRRTISVPLEIIERGRDGAPRARTELVEIDVHEDSIQSDPAHNVVGHEVSQEFRTQPEILIPQVASPLAERMARALQEALAQEEKTAVLKALADSGNEGSKPEYLHLDAVAYDVVGSRIGKPLRRATSRVSSAGLNLPIEALSFEPGQCILVAAVGPGAASLKLATPSSSLIDLRGRNEASVELCQNSQEGDREPLRLTSTTAAEVRWGFYSLSPRKKRAAERER